MWNESYPFPNINGGAHEICEWVGNFIPTLLGMRFVFHVWEEMQLLGVRSYTIKEIISYIAYREYYMY